MAMLQEHMLPGEFSQQFLVSQGPSIITFHQGGKLLDGSGMRFLHTVQSQLPHRTTIDKIKPWTPTRGVPVR